MNLESKQNRRIAQLAMHTAIREKINSLHKEDNSTTSATTTLTMYSTHISNQSHPSNSTNRRCTPSSITSIIPLRPPPFHFCASRTCPSSLIYRKWHRHIRRRLPNMLFLVNHMALDIENRAHLDGVGNVATGRFPVTLDVAALQALDHIG